MLKFIWAPGTPVSPSPAPLRLVGHWESEDGEHLFRVELCDGLYFVKGKTVEEYGGDYFGNQVTAATDADAVVTAWKFVMSLIRKRKNRDEQLLGVFYDAFTEHLNVAVPLTGHTQPLPHADYREGAAGELIPTKDLFAGWPKINITDGVLPEDYVRAMREADSERCYSDEPEQVVIPLTSEQSASLLNTLNTEGYHAAVGAAVQLMPKLPYERLSVFAAEDPEFAQRLNRSIELHAAGLSADEQPTAELLQCEFDAALSAEVAKRAADEMVEAGAEFSVPADGTPTEHQPRPLRTQEQCELADVQAHHFSTLARRSKAAKRAKQDGSHHTQETGGEG